MNKYIEMKERHQKEVNEFPMKFAFSDAQFKNAMKELGLTGSDVDKVVGIGGGGFFRKTDKQKYIDMADRQYKELQKAIKEDKIGDGFIREMFEYELSNHEYVITHDIEDTLDSLGLTKDDIRNNKNLKTGLILAEKHCLEIDEKINEDEEEM